MKKNQSNKLTKFKLSFFLFFTGLNLLFFNRNFFFFLLFFQTSSRSLSSSNFFSFNPFVYYIFLNIYSTDSILFNLLLKFDFTFFSILITDLRYFTYKYFLQCTVRPLKVKDFYKSKPVRIYSQNAFIINVDISSFTFLRTYVEHFRALKYNEYRLIV